MNKIQYLQMRKNFASYVNSKECHKNNKAEFIHFIIYSLLRGKPIDCGVHSSTGDKFTKTIKWLKIMIERKNIKQYLIPFTSEELTLDIISDYLLQVEAISKIAKYL